MDHIYRRFAKFTMSLGVPPDAAGVWWTVLHALYTDERRHYHTLHHVMACLEALDSIREEIDDPALVELALWFHDAIYLPAGTPTPSYNEERSALLAAAASGSMGLSDKIDCVHLKQAIFCTSPHLTYIAKERSDYQIVHDLDIWVLGGSWEV